MSVLDYLVLQCPCCTKKMKVEQIKGNVIVRCDYCQIYGKISMRGYDIYSELKKMHEVDNFNITGSFVV